MIWLLFGVFHSIFRAVFVEASRAFASEGWRGAFYRSLFALLLLLPVAVFMPWSKEPLFYLAACGVALIFTIGLIVQVRLSALKSGRVSSIYMPLEALLAGVIWFAIYPPMQLDYFSSPFLTLGLIAVFAGAVLALLKIRPQDISWGNFAIVAPVGLTYAIAGVVTKVVLPPALVPALAVSFITVNFAVMTALSGGAFYLERKKQPPRPDRFPIISGLVAGLFSLASFGSFVLGVSFAPNPAYISVAAMMLPVWLWLWHRMRGDSDRAALIPAVGLTASILIFLAMAVLIG